MTSDQEAQYTQYNWQIIQSDCYLQNFSVVKNFPYFHSACTILEVWERDYVLVGYFNTFYLVNRCKNGWRSALQHPSTKWTAAVFHSAWTKWVLFQPHQQQADAHECSVRPRPKEGGDYLDWLTRSCGDRHTIQKLKHHKVTL